MACSVSILPPEPWERQVHSQPQCDGAAMSSPEPCVPGAGGVCCGGRTRCLPGVNHCASLSVGRAQVSCRPGEEGLFSPRLGARFHFFKGQRLDFGSCAKQATDGGGRWGKNGSPGICSDPHAKECSGLYC